MKKWIICIACLFAGMAGTSAQESVNWSIKVGAGMTSWMGSKAEGKSALLNPKIEVGMDIPLNGLVSFQTGLAWASKGAHYKVNNRKIKVNQNYFQVPMLAAFHLGTDSDFDLVLTGGIYAAYGAHGKSETKLGDDLQLTWNTFEGATVEGTGLPTLGRINDVNRFDTGLQAGMSFDFSEYFIGVDGEFGLTRIAGSGSPRNLGIYLVVGYKF